MSTERLEAGNLLHERIALVALLQESALPKTHLAAMVEQTGSAVELLRNSLLSGCQSAGELELFDLVPKAAREKATREVESWTQYPYHVATILDDSYPAALRSIYDRPPLLFVEGPIACLSASAGVAIVGTRQATDKGKRRARKLAQAFGESGLTIISGLAAGIDTAAHSAAIAGGFTTFAVVGTGLTRVFPKENLQLSRDILASGGALVSQFLPKQPPGRATFPMRNVTMSGLSDATVVVEASETSGARMQAGAALRHGRAVFLLHSLVEAHEWARKMVEDGVHGSRATVLADPSDLLDRIDPSYSPPAFASV